MKRNEMVESLRKEMNRREALKEGMSTHPVGRANLSAVNEKLVLNYIRQKKEPISRVRIAYDLYLARPTVSAIISTLKEKGLVKEGNPLGSTRRGGKPATEVLFNAEAGYILGVDLGRRHIGMLLSNLEGKMPRNIKPHKVDSGTDLVVEDCLRLIAKELVTYLTTYGIRWDDIIGIGLGFPGTVARDLQKPIKPVGMLDWDGVEIPKRLRSLLPMSKTQLPIYLDNDANLAALGESRYGKGRNIRNLVYVKIGAGIGAGLILEGHLYRGNGAAGEFGHMVIEEGDLRWRCSGCGNYCLEAQAARSAILREAGYSDKEGALHRIAEQAGGGDEVCKAAFEHAGEHIGKALANLINLLNPQKILLGGGVTYAAGEMLLAPIRKHAQACVAAAAETGIQMGSLGKHEIEFGAVATVIDAAFGAQAILDAAFGTTSVADLDLVAAG